MADTLTNPVTTLALRAEETIIEPVYSQWVVASLEAGDEEEVKTVLSR